MFTGAYMAIGTISPTICIPYMELLSRSWVSGGQIILHMANRIRCVRVCVRARGAG